MLTVVFYAATYGTLTYLTVREIHHWWRRRTHRDRVVILRELPPRQHPTTRPRVLRSTDPSPRPRHPAA